MPSLGLLDKLVSPCVSVDDDRQFSNFFARLSPPARMLSFFLHSEAAVASRRFMYMALMTNSSAVSEVETSERLPDS